MRKQSLIISLFFSAAIAHAQVTLVNPATNGGFESGGTFAANGWTDVQLGGGAANKWYVGTAVAATGTRSAYISNDGGTNNTYNINQDRIQHFYRDITFPAATTSVTISFSWRNEAESCCDFVTVYLEDVTFTPVAGTSNPAANQIGTEYNGSSAWQTTTINLNCGAYAGQTKRLIFSWENDGSVGTDPPGAIDNVSVIAQTSASACSYTPSSMTYAPDALNAGTLLAFPDDEHSAAVNLGFTFCFNGVNYTQCVVSSNAYLAFDPSLTGSFSEWDTDPIPISVPAYLTNTIMFPWQDVDPSVSGSIRYAVYGTAPNRRFVVSFRNVAMFDCNTLKFFGQVRLFETTNEIEMHILTKTVCSTWNNEEAVEGINLGCGAVTVPGRNNTSWTTSNDAWKFTPVGCCTTVLPTEGLIFTGKKENDNHKLSWETMTELNNDYFVLERSSDGIIYNEINRQDGAINSTTFRSYSYTDMHPFTGTTYYRLRQVNTDGSFKYSNVVVLQQVVPQMDVSDVYPNPTNGDVTVDIVSPIETDVEIEMYDMFGKLVVKQLFHADEGFYSFQLPTSLLNNGVYNLRVRSIQGSFVFTDRVIKQ